MWEFEDQFGRHWEVEACALCCDAPRVAQAKGAPAPSPREIDRPGLRLALRGLDGRTVWSTWVPLPTLGVAEGVCCDPAFLQRVVDELYYSSQA